MVTEKSCDKKEVQLLGVEFKPVSNVYKKHYSRCQVVFVELFEDSDKGRFKAVDRQICSLPKILYWICGSLDWLICVNNFTCENALSDHKLVYI